MMNIDTTPLLRIAVSLIVGIVVADHVSAPWLVLFAIAVVATLLLWRYAHLQTIGIMLSFVMLGGWLMQRQQQAQTVEWPTGEVCYEAVVISEPIEKPKTIAVDMILLGNQKKVKCYLYKDERSRGVRIGDGMKIQSRISPLTDYRIGTFDYRRYLEVRGFSGSTFVSSWHWQKAQLSLKSLSRWERTRIRFLQLRSELLHRLAAHGLEGEPYAVVAAMVLGDKSALTSDLKDVYAVTGASHVLALSGLHLGIIYLLLTLLIVNRRWQMVSQTVLILSVWAFVFLVGMPVSVVRSAIMLSIYALLSLGKRNRMSVNTLAFAALVILMVSPMSLFDVGFQMSFMAVLSILVFVPWFERVFPSEYLMSHRVVCWAWGLTAVSCSAQIGVAPLVAYYFGRFSTYFLLANFIVVPAATLILYLSLVVLLVPSLAYLLLYIVRLLNTCLGWLATLPYANIDHLHPSQIQVVMVYVIFVAVYGLVITCSRASAGHR